MLDELFKRTLVIVAHPDDEVLGAGGLLAKVTRAGSTVQVIFLTSGVGARRGDESSLDSQHLRRAEAIHANNLLGCSEPVFLSVGLDNQLDSVSLLSIIHEVEPYVESLRPTAILAPEASDPNVDHQVAAKVAQVIARPYSLSATELKTFMFFGVASSHEWEKTDPQAPKQNFFVDISEVIELKLQAMSAYASEMRAWPHPRSIEYLRKSAQITGASVGMEYCEGLRATWLRG